MKEWEILQRFLEPVWNVMVRRFVFLAVKTHKLVTLRNMVLSWSAMMTRRLGVRGIVIVGMGATLYALFLFLSNQITPTSTSKTHDLILKQRWASPAPSPRIIIVDIDERSLALLAPEHGRWPWARSVLADGLERLSRAGTRAVLFNVLLSDPDKANPDADGAMEATAAMVRNAAFPLIRLNPANDAQSALQASALLAKTGDALPGKEGTVAVLLPMFATMHDRLGVANQHVDGDGIVRRYPLQWSDPGLTMPSMVARTVLLAGGSVAHLPASITLNWRNKNGRYTRVSFADLLAAPEDAALLQRFKDAVVVLGVSAPGLGQVKPTAVAQIEDDNEILATALDDALHDTHLRVMPAWMVLLIEVAIIWTLVWVGVGRGISPWLNSIFVLLQSGAGFVTMLSASYTNHLVDLSTCMIFGFSIFGVIKLVHSLDAGWSRARPGMRHAARVARVGTMLLLGYRDSQVSRAKALELQQFLESRVGLPRVIRVDDLFGGESFVRNTCADYSCQLALVDDGRLLPLLTDLRGLEIHDLLEIEEIECDTPWDPETADFCVAVAPSMLRQCADIMDRARSGPEAPAVQPA